MDLHTWLLFATTCFIASIVPGPSVLLGLNHGLRYGKTKAAASAMGITTAAFLMGFASLLGLGLILTTSGILFTIIKYAGAGYLVYLGYKVWTAPVEEYHLEKAKFEKTRSSYLKLYVQGLVVGLSNPKAIVFFGALFPQFINTSSSSVNQYFIMLSTLCSIAFVCIMIYALGGQFLSPYLHKIKFRKIFNKITGGTFLGFGAAIVVSE